MPLIVLLIGLTVMSAPVSAQSDVAGLAPGLAEQGEIHLGLFNDGVADGFMRLGWYRQGDALHLYDRTMMPSAEVYESFEAVLDGQTFAPRSAVIRFHQGTAVLDIDVAFQPDRVTGTRTVQRPGANSEAQAVDVDLVPGTMLRATSFVLPLILDATPGSSVSFAWYGPLANAASEVSLTVRDGGEIDTPAGTFDTVVFELRGGTPENDIYLSTGEPARIVRIDVLGQPLQFLALPTPD